jgi:uncharacterized protein YdhG (YjbR/CyaY superfamily)
MRRTPMDQPKSGFRSIDEYIGTFPEETRALLEQVRSAIKAAAPGAEERISYGMPAFALNGTLVYFAAWKKHIGLYPSSSGVPEAFNDELSKYEGSKGAIRFPSDQPLPLELIRRIVQYRVSENLNRAAEKGSKKKA